MEAVCGCESDRVKVVDSITVSGRWAEGEPSRTEPSRSLLDFNMKFDWKVKYFVFVSETETCLTLLN